MWLSWYLCPNVPCEVVVRCQQEPRLTWRLNWGRIRFQVQSHGYWQDLVTCGLLDWGPHFFVGSWPGASVPCHVGFFIGQLTAWKLAFHCVCAHTFRGGDKERWREGERKRELKWLPITSAAFSIFARIKPLLLVFTRGETLQWAWMPGDGIIGDHSRGCLSQMVTLIKGTLLLYNTSQWNATHNLFLFLFSCKKLCA